jgi:hypothetical protein
MQHAGLLRPAPARERLMRTFGGFWCVVAVGGAILSGCASLIGIDDVSLWDAGDADGASRDGKTATETGPEQDAAVADEDGSIAEENAVIGDRDGTLPADAASGETGIFDAGDAYATAEAGVEPDAEAAAVEACAPTQTQASACAASNCGAIDNGCGQKLACGTCPGPETCTGDGAPSLCFLVAAGCTPAARYTIVDPGNGVGGSGTGLVHDSVTGLTWMRFDSTPGGPESVAAGYCQSLGGTWTIPTEGQAQGISGKNADTCAWPAGWDTLTSTAAQPIGTVVVESNGQTEVGYETNYNDVLCVEGP